jgi:hypothetical protein
MRGRKAAQRGVLKQDNLFPFHEDVGRLSALDTLEVLERAVKMELGCDGDGWPGAGAKV